MASYTSIGDSYQAAISCYKNFSWGYKTSKTILMRFHPSQEPSEKTKQPHLQPLTLVFAKLWRRSKPELSRPQVDGVPMGGLLEPSRLIMPIPFLQIFICHKKMVVEMGKDHEKPTIPPGQHQHRPRNWAYFAFPSDFHANSCDWRFSSLGRMLSWRNYPPKDHLGEDSEFPYQIPWWLLSIPEMIFQMSCLLSLFAEVHNQDCDTNAYTRNNKRRNWYMYTH